MIKPDIATELERVNEKLAMILVEGHNAVIDKLDLLIKMMKRNENDTDKIEAIKKVLDDYDTRLETGIGQKG